jgi:general secretion pathway protein F
VSIAASTSAPSLTLDQLAALSHEMAALARAGVPLDRGLRELGRELPGRLGKVAADVSSGLAEGKALDAVVADIGTALPPAYRTVIAAGLRAGRLPAALEDVARTARVVSQLRRSIGLALLYPMVVLSLTWVLGLAILIKVMPVMLGMLREYGLANSTLDIALERLIATAPWWGPVVPILLLLWFAWIWHRTGRVSAGVELHPLLAFGAVRSLALMQRAARCASLAELLALLLNHNVPLPEAVDLASGAIGSRSLARGGRELAERLRRGERIDKPPSDFPPLLAWTIASGQAQGQLAMALAHSAEVYRDEANRRSQWLSLYVPLFLTFAVCGGVVFIYAKLTLGPWIALLRKISAPF